MARYSPNCSPASTFPAAPVAPKSTTKRCRNSISRLSSTWSSLGVGDPSTRVPDRSEAARKGRGKRWEPRWRRQAASSGGRESLEPDPDLIRAGMAQQIEQVQCLTPGTDGIAAAAPFQVDLRGRAQRHRPLVPILDGGAEPGRRPVT